jgi:hypothetical protein
VCRAVSPGHSSIRFSPAVILPSTRMGGISDAWYLTQGSESANSDNIRKYSKGPVMRKKG